MTTTRARLVGRPAPDAPRLGPPRGAALALLFLGLVGAFTSPAHGADGDAGGKKAPLGQFVTVGSPVDDLVFARVNNAAIKLQNLAVKEKRPAYLVLQIEPGTSQFHHVQGLAKFLTSAQIANVTTVAWVPETVTGPNVLVALACRQIVMNPDAELGDIGRGKPLDPDDRQGVLAIAQKRHNPRVNTALARGMMDPDEQLWKVRVKSTETGKEELESRVVTKDELETLSKTNVAIEEPQVIKAARTLGKFRGDTARNLDILVVQTATSRGAVGDLFSLPREALREQAPENEARNVRLIKIDGIIDRLLESFLMRQIDRAERSGAQVIVFQIDSPGGLADASFRLAQRIAALEEQKIRTIAYVPGEALSGGTIIALGCDEIIMHPNAKIGDAAPIQIRPGEAFERAPEKILSPMLLELKDLAVKKHRPAALCMAMADRKARVFEVTHRDTGRVWYMNEDELKTSGDEWIVGKQVAETTNTNEERLLTVNGERAHELKLAEPPVADVSELKARIGLPPSAELRPIERTWIDGLVFVLNSRAVTVLLLMLGVVLIYVELQFMTGILGILSVLCFALFFWSRFLGGTAGWLEVVLFVIGLGCLALEIFVIPGFGVFGVSGILLILASLVMAGHSWTTDLVSNVEGLAVQTGWVLLSFGLVGVLGIALAKYLPQLPMFEAMILGPPGTSAETEPRLRLDTNTGRGGLPTGDGMSVGQQGVSMTMLRPAGKARLNDRVVDVVSEGPFIAADAAIEVTAISGSRIVVREV
jgi:membrane-bound serine protease (ClpP class)